MKKLIIKNAYYNECYFPSKLNSVAEYAFLFSLTTYATSFNREIIDISLMWFLERQTSK